MRAVSLGSNSAWTHPLGPVKYTRVAGRDVPLKVWCLKYAWNNERVLWMRERAGAHFAPAGASGHPVNCNVQLERRELARSFYISAGDKDDALSELAGVIFCGRVCLEFWFRVAQGFLFSERWKPELDFPGSKTYHIQLSSLMEMWYSRLLLALSSLRLAYWFWDFSRIGFVFLTGILRSGEKWKEPATLRAEWENSPHTCARKGIWQKEIWYE